MAATNSTQRVNENLYLVDEYGVKYSADGKTLISVPKGLPYYEVLNGTEIIGREAFMDSDVEMVLLPCTIQRLSMVASWDVKPFTLLNCHFQSKRLVVSVSVAVKACVNYGSLT